MSARPLTAILMLVGSLLGAQDQPQSQPPPQSQQPPASQGGSSDTSAQPTPPILTPPTDNQRVWTVGFASLQAIDVDPQYQYLSYSIPLVLKERLQRISDHQLSPQERTAKRAEIVAAQVRQLSGVLDKRRAERDAAAAQAGDKAARDRDRALEQIQDLKTQIAYLQGLDLEQVDVPVRKPLTFWTSSTPAATSLLDAPRYSPLQTARAAGVDLLVFGSVEQVQDYLFFSVRAMDYPRGEVLLDYQDAFLPSDVYQGLQDLADELAGVLLGESWGALVIRAAPEGALLRVDGAYVGKGETRIEYQRAGVVKVSAEAQGYASGEQVATVTAGETTTVVFGLQATPADPITLTSSPLLADVYLDSQWVGRTPVEVPRPVGLERVELFREGYEARRFHLAPASPVRQEVDLTHSIWSADDRQKTTRNRFYGALGALIVSLPIPIVLYAASLDYATAYLQAQAGGDAEDEHDAVVAYRRLYGAYLGGLFVSASLGLNMIINLVTYVGSADRPAG